jgi:CubicO group peptidase (beta-lactamase class C family)
LTSAARAATLRDMRIDDVLAQAVDRREVPGVVAMAATERGLLYEGAFGQRLIDTGPAMTMDTMFRIASMTKAVTSVAAMQLVEQGKLALDAPVPDIDPALSAPRVLGGFDAQGQPRLRPAQRAITLKHLLTHTAGFSYEAWNEKMARYVPLTGMPAHSSGKVAGLRMPLVHDPGQRWEYGINTDWVGRIVEAISGQPLDVYFREKIFGPLGMKDATFAPSDEQRARQARAHQREADGTLTPHPPEPPAGKPEFWAGGGGLFMTAPDYTTFLQALLLGGTLKGARVLRPETVALMARNHTADLPCGVMATQQPLRTNPVDFFPGARLRWGLGYMLNLDPGPNGRSAGTVSWGGLLNSYYWIDPVKRITGAIFTQILPFADPRVLAVYGAFERAVYEAAR